MIRNLFSRLAIWLVVPALSISPVDSHALQLTKNEVDSLYYISSRTARLYRDIKQSQPYLHLRFREPVRVIAVEGSVKKIQTMDGATGYVLTDALSNIWIHVSKRRRQVTLHRGLDVVAEFRADFGYNAYSDKLVRGSHSKPDHWRTPEGGFYVVKKNPHSKFYRAFLLSYPNAEDAERGKENGLITEQEYEAIMKAERRGIPPPMGTTLGGMIEIHGNGTGFSSNWTQGCVAVRDTDMDFMWTYVQEGAPVIIEK